MSYSNGTLHASVVGEYNDNLPLANVTIVGAAGEVGSVAVNCGQGEGQAHAGYGAGEGNGTSDIQSRYENGVVYLTGLESMTQGGVWSSDLEISLS